MSDKTYWRRRAKQYEEEWLNRCKEELETELRRYFEDSLEEIEKDIMALYASFKFIGQQPLPNFHYSEARRLIRGKEYRRWRMTLEEYVRLSHKDSKILRELEVLSRRSRISRLEKIYTDTLKSLQNLGEKYEKATKDFLTTAYKERYYNNIYDLAKVGKLEIPLAHVEPSKLEKVLAQKWQGGNYSSRIWKDTEKLSAELKKTITTSLHRGLSVQKLSKSLAKKMDVSYSNAERLVRTELNFVSNMSTLESLEAAGLKEYEFIATLDHRTTPRCQDLDGSVHLISEYEVGTNAPPMHPRCRSTISALVEGGTRTAKVNGKNIRVPADMKYKDYKEIYIEKTRSLENWQIFHTPKIPIKIDNIGDAVIPTAKLTKYALKDTNKARAFESALGYNLSNVEKLIDNIKAHINEYKIVERPKTPYGEPFQIKLELTGENGKTAKVTTGWIKDSEMGEIRLTSIYVDK